MKGPRSFFPVSTVAAPGPVPVQLTRPPRNGAKPNQAGPPHASGNPTSCGSWAPEQNAGGRPAGFPPPPSSSGASKRPPNSSLCPLTTTGVFFRRPPGFLRGKALSMKWTRAKLRFTSPARPSSLGFPNLRGFLGPNGGPGAPHQPKPLRTAESQIRPRLPSFFLLALRQMPAPFVPAPPPGRPAICEVPPIGIRTKSRPRPCGIKDWKTRSPAPHGRFGDRQRAAFGLFAWWRVPPRGFVWVGLNPGLCSLPL